MQAAVDAARSAQEQPAEDALPAGRPTQWPPVQADPPAGSAPAEHMPPAEPVPPAKHVPPAEPVPPAELGSRAAAEPITTGLAGTGGPAAIQGWPQWPGNGGSVRQPSPSGTAFAQVPVQAPPQPGRKARSRGPRPAAGPKGPRVAGAAALTVIILAAGAVAVALSARGGQTHAPATSRPAARHSQVPQASGRPGGPAARTVAGLAASWVDRQVSHDATVACDKAMCRALAAHGFPGRHLKLITPGAPYPGRAQVVVETPAIRHQFGARRNADLAPPVLAMFGHGAAAISIRVVAPQGAAAYKAQIKADVRQRRGEGAGLLTNSQVKASPTARKELVAGRVDTRLIVVLTAIASVHPIDIAGFGTAFAGSSPDLPLRTAELALTYPAAHLSEADYLRFLLTQLDAQPDAYRPLTVAPVRGSAGKRVLQITFAAPSPLKLLG